MINIQLQTTTHIFVLTLCKAVATVIYVWYTDRLWVCYYIWYSKEGPDRAAAPPMAPLCCTKCNSTRPVYHTYFFIISSCWLHFLPFKGLKLIFILNGQ